MSDSTFDLSGRLAVITGASSGIGAAMAGFLAEAGADVAIVARRADALERTADTCRSHGVVAHAVVGDMGSPEAAQAVAGEVCARAGDPHIVVNAAGVNLRQPVDEVTPESWRQTLDLNLAAPFFFAREFVPVMRAHGFGRVINIASLQSDRAFPNGLPYGASKGGVSQLTRAMAEAWSADGITCNAIAPGFFPTELTAPVFGNPETESWAAGQTAIGRNGTMEDLRGPTVFFASAGCQFVTGQVLFVDGGFTAR